MTELLDADLLLNYDDALARVEELRQTLEDALTSAAEIGTAALANDFKDAFSSLADDAATPIASIRDDLAAAIASAADDGSRALDVSFADSTTQVRDDLTTAITDAADSGAAALDQSLSSVGDSVGNNLTDSIATAFSAQDSGVTDFGNLIAATVEGSAVAGGDALGEAFGPHLDPTITAMGEALIQAIQDAATQGGADLADALSNAADTGGQAISDSLSGTGSGASSAAAGIDQLGQSARGTQSSVGSLVDTTAILGGTTALATGNIGGLDSVVGGIGLKTVGAAAGIGLIVEATHKLITAGIEGTAATQRFNSIIGEFADQVRNVKVGNLNTDIEHLGLSLGTVPSKLENSAANIFQLGVNAGLTKPKVAQVTDEIIALASRAVALKPSLGDVGAVADRMALQLGRGGIRVQGYGVQLTAAQISAEALRETHKELTSQLTPFEKTVAGVTLATTQYGNHLKQDIEKGTENAAIKQRSFNAEIQYFIEKVGEPLVAPFFQTIEAGLPGIEALAKALGTLAINAMPAVLSITKVLTPVLQGLGDAIGFIGPALPPMIDAFLAFKLISFVPKLIDEIGTKLKGMVPSSATFREAVVGDATKTAAAKEGEAAAVTAANTAIQTSQAETTLSVEESSTLMTEALAGSGAGVAAALEGTSADFVAWGETVTAATSGTAEAVTGDLGVMDVALTASGVQAGMTAEEIAVAMRLGTTSIETTESTLGAMSFTSLASGIGSIALPLAVVGGVLFTLAQNVDIFGSSESDAQKAGEDFDKTMSHVTGDALSLQHTLFGSVKDIQSYTAAFAGLNKALSDNIVNQSQFKTDKTVDDIHRIGLTVQQTAADITRGSQGFQDFAGHFLNATKGAVDLSAGIAHLGANAANATPEVGRVMDALRGGGFAAVAERTGNATNAFIKATAIVKQLGGSYFITADQIAKFNDAQLKTFIQAEKEQGVNAKSIADFKELQTAYQESLKATYAQIVADDQLTANQEAAVLAFSKGTDGQTDWTVAIKNATLAAQGAGPAFNALDPRVGALSRTFQQLADTTAKVAAGLPDLGTELDKVMQERTVAPMFGGGLDTTGIITSINDESKAITDFFANIDRISSTSPALTEALLKLGPDNLGARTAATLAASKPEVRAGWEIALEGLQEAEINATNKTNLFTDQFKFVGAAIQDATVEGYAQEISGGKSLDQLTLQQLEQVADHFKDAGGSVGPAATQFLNTAQQQFLDFAQHIGLDAGTAATNWQTQLTQGISDAVPGVQAAVKPVADALKIDVTPLLTKHVANSVELNQPQDKPVDFTTPIDAAFDKLRTNAKQVGRDLPAGLADGVTENTKVGDAAVRGWTDHVLSTLRGQFGIASPSKVTKEMGRDLIRGLADGLNDPGLGINKAASDVADHVESEIRKQLHLAGIAHAAIIDFSGALNDPGLGINKAADDVAAKVEHELSVQLKASELRKIGHDAIGHLADGMTEDAVFAGLAAGGAIDAGIAAGIVFGYGPVGVAVGLLADKLVKDLKDKLKISSPSQVMFELGQQTMQGYRDGIESFVTPITDAASKVAEAGKTVFSQQQPVATPQNPGFIPGQETVPLSLLGQTLPPGVHIEHLHVENVSPDPVVQGFEASRQLAAAVYRGGR